MDTELKPGDKVKKIPPEAMIKLEVSGSFYAELQQILFVMLDEQRQQGKDSLEINKRLKELENEPPQNLWEVQILTILGLIFAIEKAAQEQKLMVETDALDFIKNSVEGASPES